MVNTLEIVVREVVEVQIIILTMKEELTSSYFNS